MTLAVFYVHTLTVETYLGQQNNQPAYAAPVSVVGFLDTNVNLQRGSGSDQVTDARSMFYCAPENASVFTVQSRVSSADLSGDGKATVVTVNALTSGSLGLPDHVEVGLL